MLAEEPAAGTPNEMPPAYSAVVDDGRWEPGTGGGGGNTITMRHRGKGNANFADGHAQAIDYKFGADPHNTNPVLN